VAVTSLIWLSLHETVAGDTVTESDQRACRRADFAVAVDLESDHYFYAGVTSNISAGGLFLATEDLRRIGECVTLRFTLPDEVRPLTVEAVVRWVRKDSASRRGERATGMGLQFLSLTPEALASITRFVETSGSLHRDEG
jgi:uncharacterized protein (TIGR02266 family)